MSAIASTEGQENEDGAQAARVQACKAADKNENSTEKATRDAHKGDKTARKAARNADRDEDKTERQAFAACVAGQTA